MKIKELTVGLILLITTFLLGYTVEQHEFNKIITYYSLFFLGYVFIINHLVKGISKSTLYYFIGLAILLRLILVFALPNLSNDVYRFIWDGRLLVQGYNPFDHLPQYYLENEIGIKGINLELFEAYGSKNFYTVYPPIAQMQFASACWLFPNSAYWSAVIMKVWLFVFEIGSIYLIIRLLEFFKLPQSKVLLYASTLR